MTATSFQAPPETTTATRQPAREENRIQFNWIVAVALVTGAAITMPFDVSFARFFMSDPLPGELRSLIHKTEFFGHAYGILGIAFTIYLLCDNRRRQLPRLLCTAFAAGIACDVVKLLIHRVRPVAFSFETGEATFRGLSFLSADSMSQIFDSSMHSFPSAHTATAVAFAIALGAMFSQGARWFVFLAAMCAISRFDGGAHYVSDTFIGGLLGYAVACRMLGASRVGNWFTAFEENEMSFVEFVKQSLPAWRFGRTAPRPTPSSVAH